MKLKRGAINAHFRSSSDDAECGLRIDVKDREACVTFAVIKLSKDQVLDMLSGRGYVDAEIEVVEGALGKIGKKQEVDHITFPCPNYPFKTDEGEKMADLTRLAIEAIMKKEPEIGTGWVPDRYYGSQTSFFTKDGQKHARTMIRRWVPMPPDEPTNKDVQHVRV